jgi:hypothetical protein
MPLLCASVTELNRGVWWWYAQAMRLRSCFCPAFSFTPVRHLIWQRSPKPVTPKAAMYVVFDAVQNERGVSIDRVVCVCDD